MVRSSNGPSRCDRRFSLDMNRWSCLQIVFLILIVFFTSISDVQAQARLDHHTVSTATSVAPEPQQGHVAGGGVGLPEDIAYSEFQHHIVGFGDTLFGLTELGQALQYPLPLWTRLALPTILAAIGVYNLGWSDRDAWPIGSLGFADTFFGQDREIMEHKFAAVLALVIAVCEVLRRTGRVRHPAWAAPLVVLSLVGSLLLFVHSHLSHSAASRIDLHHAVLGAVGICASVSKGLASWLPGASPQVKHRWEIAWGGGIILYGLLLLVYSE